MEVLSAIFSSMKFKNVKTLIQSGNVLFDSSDSDVSKLTKRIEKGLYKALAYDVPVMLKTVEEIEGIIKLDPFKNAKPNEEIKSYVTFLSHEPEVEFPLPLISPKKDIEVILLKNKVAYCLCRKVDSGSSSFPNAFIEQKYKVSATTRNWNTIGKLIK